MPLDFEKQLYHLKNSNIEIDIRLGFEGDALRLIGYDIGKSVEDAWGDSDYEYEITVKDEGLIKLYGIHQILIGQKETLVNKIAETITGNFAYSMFEKYLDKHKVKYESFTWT